MRVQRQTLCTLNPHPSSLIPVDRSLRGARPAYGKLRRPHMTSRRATSGQTTKAANVLTLSWLFPGSSAYCAVRRATVRTSTCSGQTTSRFLIKPASNQAPAGFGTSSASVRRQYIVGTDAGVGNTGTCLSNSEFRMSFRDLRSSLVFGLQRKASEFRQRVKRSALNVGVKSVGRSTNMESRSRADGV